MNLEELRALGLEPHDVLRAAGASRLDRHPDPGQILACLAGECPPEETEAIRDHLALCSDCADVALVLGTEEDDPVGQRAFDAAVAAVLEDQPGASEWQALAERIRSEKSATPRRPARSRTRSWFPALAAALVLVTVGSGLWIHHLQSAVDGMSDFRPGALTLHLTSHEDPLLGAEGRDTVARETGIGDLAIYLHLPAGAPPGPYRVVLRRDAGETGSTLWEASGLEAEDGRAVFLTVDRRRLDPGEYRLELSVATADEPFATYDLQVESWR